MLNIESASSAHTSSTHLGVVPGLFSHRRPLSILIFDLKTLIFLSVNDTAIQQYGYSLEEFMAMTLKDILQKERIARFLSYARGTPKMLMNASLWKHHKKDGNSIDVEMSCYKFMFKGKQAMLALIKEIAEHDQLHEAPIRGLQKNLAGTRRSKDIISRVDRRLMFLELNRAIDKLTGITENALLRKTIATPNIRMESIYSPAAREYLRSSVIGQILVRLQTVIRWVTAKTMGGRSASCR